MRIRLTKEYDGQPAGFQGDWPDDRAKAAVDAGAAVPTARVRLTRDYDLGGRKLPARFEFDLSPDEAAKAVGDGAGEYADEKDRERAAKVGGEKPEPPAPAAEPEPRRARTPKAEG